MSEMGSKGEIDKKVRWVKRGRLLMRRLDTTRVKVRVLKLVYTSDQTTYWRTHKLIRTP